MTALHARCRTVRFLPGALSEQIYRALVARNVIESSKIRQIGLSEPVPNYPMTMQGNLAPALKESYPQGLPRDKGPAGAKILPRGRLRGRPTTKLMTFCAIPRRSLISISRRWADDGGTLHGMQRFLLTSGAPHSGMSASPPESFSSAWRRFGSRGFFDAERLIAGIPALAQLASEMVPPDFSRWQNWIKPLVDTLAMSIAGTALAVVISLPLALLAAPNIAPNALVYQACRIVLSALRSVPEIIMGIIFVAAVGFGALPGVLALALHSVGMVGKFYAEAIEHVDPQTARSCARRRRQSLSGHHACRSAAGSAATCRHHDLPLGVPFPRFDCARHRRRWRHRLRADRGLARHPV